MKIYGINKKRTSYYIGGEIIDVVIETYNIKSVIYKQNLKKTN